MNSRIMRSPVFWLLFIVLAAQFLMAYGFEKGYWVLWLNEHHTDIGNLFFKYWTHYGNGYIFAVLAGLFVLVSFRYLILLAFTVSLQTLVTQVMKRIIFKDMVRPKIYFGDSLQSLDLVEGVKLHGHFSFPSGHTSTAFAASVFMMLLIKNEWLRLVILVAGVLAGLSRVYIIQHFMVDVAWGALIGTFAAIVIVVPAEQRQWFWSSKLKNGLLRS